MDELGRKDILEIELQDGSFIFGYVYEYSKDRVAVVLDLDSIEPAKNLKELDEVTVTVHTRFGIKSMVSHVISGLNHLNRIIIENASTATINQKRENVRAVDSFNFTIKINGKTVDAECLDVSAGGIAFSSEYKEFQKNQIVEVIFAENIFSKQISCNAQIVNVTPKFFSAKFLNLNVYDESKITKRVFTILSGK